MRTIGSAVNGGRWRRYVVCTGRLRSPDVGTVAARLCCTQAILTLKCQRLARTHTAPEAVCELRPELQGLLGGWLSGPQVDRMAVEPCTISLGMIVTVSLDLPKRRSARILTSPRVTVSPRNRPPYRARNGHAYGSGGRRCRLANLCAGLARRRCCRADSEDRSAYVSDHAHRGAAAHSCSADHPGARAGRIAALPSIVQRYITSTWPCVRCRKRPS